MLQFRKERITQLLKKNLSLIIQKEKYKDPRITAFITITKLKITGDFKQVDVYFSIFGSDLEVNKNFNCLLEGIRRIRYALGCSVRLKYVPRLNFKLDDIHDRVTKLQKKFDKF